MRQRTLRRRRRTLAVAAAVAALVVVVVAAGGPASAPALSVRVELPSSKLVAAASLSSRAPALPWPATGGAAVTIPLVGYTAQSGPEQAVPVASLTKLVTAYVVLHDHPLGPDGKGPRVTMTEADATNFGTDTVSDQASVEVQAGEVLTEYQLLAGLLVHSANDFAYALATWDAGTVTAFVDRMNAAAAGLGMSQSHFTDASGFEDTSTSTAADMLKVATADMAIPAFAAIVAMPSVTLPIAGTVTSYTPLVGTENVVGVKSGFTTAAGGGDVLAYRASLGGQSVLVLAAVTSQEGPTVLDVAGNEALAVAQAAVERVEATTVARRGAVVGQVRGGARPVPVALSAAAALLVAPGQVVHQTVRVARHLRIGSPAGTTVGTATFAAGTQVVSVPVRTLAAIS